MAKTTTSRRRSATGKIIKRRVPHVEYEKYLLKDLQDLDYAAGYLTACLEEGEDVFLLGIRHVAKAQGGMKALATATNLNRENLYDMLSKEGNPRLSSLTTILDSLGFELKFAPKIQGTKAA